MINNNSPNSLLTLQEVADHCRVSVKTIQRWIKQNKLPAFKLGNQWRVHQDDLELFLAKCKK